MNDRLNGMSQTSCILEERLRRTKMEIHVQADGQVILVIGDVKGNDLLLLSLGIFDKREHETAVCLFIAGLDFLDAPINQRLLLNLLSRTHGEEDFIAHFIIGRVIRTSMREDTEHIKDAQVALVLRLNGRLVPVGALLLHVRFAVSITVPSLINGITLAFLGTLPIIYGLQILCHNTGYGIAHLEVEIGLLAAYTMQIEAVGLLLPIGCVLRVQRGISNFLPNEFPVEVQVINNALSTLECIVSRLTLCECRTWRQAAKKQTGHKEPTNDEASGLTSCCCSCYCFWNCFVLFSFFHHLVSVSLVLMVSGHVLRAHGCSTFG